MEPVGQKQGRDERNRKYAQWSGAALADGSDTAPTTAELKKSVKMQVDAIKMSLKLGIAKVQCSGRDPREQQLIAEQLSPEELQKVVF